MAWKTPDAREIIPPKNKEKTFWARISNRLRLTVDKRPKLSRADENKLAQIQQHVTTTNG